MENSETRREAGPGIVCYSAMLQNQGRVSTASGLSPDSRYGGRKEDSHGGASRGMVSLQQQPDTGRIDNQSQEREKGGQSANKSRTRHLLGTAEACAGSASCEAESSKGISSSEDPYQRGGRDRDQALAGIGRDGEGYSRTICDEYEGDIGDLSSPDVAACLTWPLPNVWLGVSVENQATADERIPLLLQTPAKKRFISYEPALSAVDFARLFATLGIDQLIIGGESGPGSRPFDIQWARDTIAQCKAAGVACFVKQLGARPYAMVQPDGYEKPYRTEPELADRKGGDMAEWPEDLRVREFPI